LSQFSHVILLHGVYREIFQLKDCFARPLGKWVPSMQQALDESSARKNTSVLDANGQSLLSSWRNAALDCVDVLHWAANATIALQAGAEHPTVLHLHFSRTVLLAPFDQIQILAASIASVSPNFALAQTDASSGEQIAEAEHDVLNWAQRDQYKARLAVLHCGCLFWHIRRYSCKAFYEPHAVYLATLTMWAYSSYAARAKGGDRNETRMSNADYGRETTSSSPQDSGDRPSPISDVDVMPTFIHLDRPNDDEMVQHFVLSGSPSHMNAHISGVGDLYSPRGPARILREGRKVLNSVCTAWGRTKKYVALLQALENVSSGRGLQDIGTPSDSHAHQT
jgi:predicted membrane protein